MARRKEMAATLRKKNQKKQLFRFFGLFLGGILLFYIFYNSEFYRSGLSIYFIQFQGVIVEFVLNLFGANVQLTAGSLVGSKAKVDIMQGCDGLEPIALFTLAVLLMPFHLKIKIRGLLFGILSLLILNMLRIAGLYLAKAHFPNWFDPLHVHGGFMAFMCITVFIWLVWLKWAFRQNQIDAA